MISCSPALPLFSLSRHSHSTFLRLLCGEALPSAGCVSIEANGAKKTSKVSAPLVEGKSTPDQDPLVPGTGSFAQNGDRTRAQPRAGTAPPCGVSYLGRYWTETVTIPPSQKAERVLADAFCVQKGPEKQPRREPPWPRKIDGVGCLTENLLCVAGLGDVRDSRCGDLYRSQLLVLVLCVGVARAVVSGQAAGSRGGEALAVTDQRERHHSQPAVFVTRDTIGGLWPKYVLLMRLVNSETTQFRLSITLPSSLCPTSTSPFMFASCSLCPPLFSICSLWTPCDGHASPCYNECC